VGTLMNGYDVLVLCGISVIVYFTLSSEFLKRLAKMSLVRWHG
jgi:hypothetical protein